MPEYIRIGLNEPVNDSTRGQLDTTVLGILQGTSPCETINNLGDLLGNIGTPEIIGHEGDPNELVDPTTLVYGMSLNVTPIIPAGNSTQGEAATKFIDDFTACEGTYVKEGVGYRFSNDADETIAEFDEKNQIISAAACICPGGYLFLCGTEPYRQRSIRSSGDAFGAG